MFQINLRVEPIILVFQQLLFQRLLVFFRLAPFPADAYKQLLPMGSGSGGGGLELKAEVRSPTLLVPFQSNNDPNSPTWSFRLGDLSLSGGLSNIKVGVQHVGL